MGMMRPYEQERNFNFHPKKDHRHPWQRKAVRFPDGMPELIKLLRAYLAIHGDWREITANGEHYWEFTVCECELCQVTGEVVDHPERPYV